MIIKGLHFKQTCSGCPEQYDVFDENGNLVGYIRLRWGELRCEYPSYGGIEIYNASVGNGWAGVFPTDRLRTCHLTKIANAILERMKGEKHEY